MCLPVMLIELFEREIDVVPGSYRRLEIGYLNADSGCRVPRGCGGFGGRGGAGDPGVWE